MRKNKRSPYLFPASYANKPISSQALAKWMHEQKEFSGRLVPHGLRTIGRSWFADHEIPFEVAEACLAHVVGSQGVRASVAIISRHDKKYCRNGMSTSSTVLSVPSF